MSVDITIGGGSEKQTFRVCALVPVTLVQLPLHSSLLQISPELLLPRCE